jgi:two-component system, response regulator PdtaR
MSRNGSVLVVEDEFLVAELLSIMLEELGLEVCGTAVTADQALTIAEAQLPALVLMDVRLKGQTDGIDAAAAIRRATGAPVIFVTGSAEPATIARIAQCHPASVLLKPIRFEQLRDAVTQAMA